MAATTTAGTSGFWFWKVGFFSSFDNLTYVLPSLLSFPVGVFSCTELNVLWHLLMFSADWPLLICLSGLIHSVGLK